MQKVNILEDLQVAIDLVARETPALPSQQVAEKFYEDEPALIAHVSREWIIEKLAALIRARRLSVSRDQDPQMTLFGFQPPKRILLGSGERRPFAETTLWQLRLYRRSLVKKKSPAVDNVEKAISIMERYAAKHRGITWAEVMKRETEKKARKA